jgi:hypothetical protein
MKLHPALGPLVGETPASVISRNALRHRAPSARAFCLDLGLTFQDVVDGRTAALGRISDLLQVPVGLLTRSAITRTEVGYEFRGQSLLRQSLRRSRVAVCPRCLAEDLADGRPPWHASGRVEWLLTPIRTCHRHGVTLVEAAHVTSAHAIHDFARNIEGILPDVGRMADEATVAPSTKLEAYLLDRVAGIDETRHGWLDALSWHAVARVCEMMGAVAVNGPMATIRDYVDEDWRRAGEAGFEIASGGVVEIRRFLDRMRRSYPDRRVDNGGPQAWFGRLHTWLTDSVSERAYEPLRDLVVGYVADTVPVGPEDEFFGRRVVQRRRLHSIRTAALETGLHPKRLRKILAAGGLLPPSHTDLSDDRVVFDADEASELLASARRAISQAAAAAYTDAGRVQFALLVDHGFIKAGVTSEKKGLRGPTYDPVDLDAFLVSLLDGAIEVEAPYFPIVNIPEAAKRANCGAAEVVRLILGRKLAKVWRRAGAQGYASVFVDCEEIRNMIRQDYGPDLNLRAVEAELRTSTRVVDALVAIGVLPSRRATNPLNRCPYTAVRKDDLEAFSARYVSLHALAREKGIHFMALKRDLIDRGIQPAFDHSTVPATFYLREAIPD